MADKIEKFLKKLSRKEFELFESLLLDIRNDQLENLDVKPLKGLQGIYRVRKGQIRIIFSKKTTGLVIILELARRDDQTYRNF
jgi:mRNA-degrading endonuclease RelE of RelBE toxin-antitoxin system